MTRHVMRRLTDIEQSRLDAIVAESQRAKPTLPPRTEPGGSPP